MKKNDLKKVRFYAVLGLINLFLVLFFVVSGLNRDYSANNKVEFVINNTDSDKTTVKQFNKDSIENFDLKDREYGFIFIDGDKLSYYFRPDSSYKNEIVWIKTHNGPEKMKQDSIDGLGKVYVSRFSEYSFFKKIRNESKYILFSMWN